MPSPKLGVTIGIPSVGWQSTLFMKHMLSLVMPLNTIVTYKVVGTRRYGDEVRPVAEADNIIMYEALRERAKYLFFVEEDVIVPQMALRQLMATLGRHPDATVAAGIVTAKTIPPEPMIYKEDGEGAYWNFQRGEIFPIHSCHMGCTLIRLDHIAQLVGKVPAVELLEYPEPGEKAAIPQFFRTTAEVPDRTGKSKESQDIFFANLLAQAGLKILADANVMCGHFDLDRGILYGMPESRPNPNGKAQVVNLGAGLDWDFIDGINPVRVDINPQNNPDFRADIRALPNHWTNKWDIVFSSHALEHFDRYELPRVFAEMVRVCKPGGEIRLVLPSMDWALSELAKGTMTGKVIDIIWGGRSVPAVGPYPQMYHKMGLTSQYMGSLIKRFKLAGRSRRIGYNQVYRLFKPPLSDVVKVWLKEPDTEEGFKKRFVDMEEETPESRSNGKDPNTVPEKVEDLVHA